MIIYTKNKDYKIWANTDNKTFHIQMTGKEIEDKGYETAAKAIESAEAKKE